MRAVGIARKYADALYQVAEEKNAIEATERELRTIVDGLQGTPEFGRFLSHPLISKTNKIELVETTFPDLSTHSGNMLRLLIRNRRESYLDLVYDQFVEVRIEAQGFVKVDVIAARPLDEEESRKLSTRLETALGRQIQLEERIDEKLIGGARIEIDGRVIDGTLWARLGKLRALLGE